MTKTKKILLIVGAVLLVACLAVILAFCGKPGTSDPSTQPNGNEGEIWTYTIKVTAVGGAPLEGVGVYVYEDPDKVELTWFDKTDANGEISFTAPVKNRYAVLSDVPAGYIVEELYSINGRESLFVLSAAPIEDVDPEEVRYELGDTIGDFTVVDTDGTEHKLSELLQQKKAVVLNFWYVECNPCRVEFPYLQEAYEQYSDQIEVIAMNPVNTSEEDIAAFKSELGLTFPVAMVDAQWADMLQLTAYPTTVVIDRFGVISLIHTGSIDSADTFEQMFAYFAAEDYVQGVVENLEDILTEEMELGTAENPEQLGATSTKITVPAGKEYHVDFYKASGMYMNVTGSDFYVIYDGKKTESSSGYVGMMVESEGIYYPVKVVFGNNTNQDQTLSVSFGALKGSLGNPYALELGEFTMNTYAGNSEGVFGTYTAEESGTLTVRCLSSSVSDYGFFLYNLRSYAMRNTNDEGATDEDGYVYTSVQVKEGDKVQFSVAVEPDADHFISAGSFRFELSLVEGDGEEDKKAEPPKTTYSITVTDQDGNAVEGVGVNLKGEFTYEPTENDPEDLEPTEVKVDLNLTTDAEGNITSEQVSGPYTAVVRVPEGYRLEQTEYALTAETNTVTLQLQKIVMVDYIITVIDAEGSPVAGVSLMMGANFGTTNEEGVYTVSMEEAEQSVFVFAGVPEGYVTPADAFLIPVGESQLTIQLEKEAEPEPEYTDIFGEFPIVTDQLAPGQKAYYNVYNAGGADLVIEDADAFVAIDEVTYEAVDGVVTAPIPVTMGRMPVQVIVGNGGAETESYTANVVFPVGTQQNPEELTLGEFTAELAEGNSTGYHYIWTAAEDGALTIVQTGEAGVAGETFDVMLTNNTSFECPLMSESEDGKTVTVAVKAGDQVSVLVSTVPDENWQYPANTVELNASFGVVHVHEYTAVVTAPTCTEGGYTTYTCACGHSYVGDEVPATGHQYQAVVTAPTCTEKGYTTFTCDLCEHSYVGDEVAALGHQYEAVVTAPTCTEDGYTTYTCACGDSYVGDEVAALGHDYTSKVIEPTTTTEGYTLHTCSRCGDSYKDNFTDKLPEDPEEPPHVHEYTAVVTAPTCTEDGYTTYTCACGHSYVGDEVEATGHQYEAVVTAPTCTEKGYTTYTCSVCEHSYVGDEVAAAGHQYQAVVTAPTCTEKGYTTYTCSVCEHSYVGDEVAAAGHQYQSVVTAPTCTEKGYTTYTCDLCEHSYVGDEVEALGHDYISEVIAPTTTTEGYTLHTCSRCGDSYKDNFTEKLPETPDEPFSGEYTVTVTGFDGTPMAGVAVQILKNGTPVKVGVTDASGKLTATLDPDSYQVKLAFSTTGNHYEESTAVLTAEAPALTILVTSALPTTGIDDHWMLGKADAVGLGGTYVSIQKNVMTYFLFTPEEAGTYRFTTSDPAALISYWGGETFPSNQTASTDYKDNVFTLSVSESYLGVTYVIGVTGADDCILIIERQGEAAFDPNEVPYTDYELAEEPKPFTLVEDGTLTFVDMSAETADYELVLGTDGYYHLGTADGPVMYVSLGGQAPYLSLYAMCGGGGVTGAPFRYSDYSDMDNIIKEDYTQCILDYGACMDSKYGVYPMTEDLYHILQNGVEHMGWADPENPNFLFAEVTDYNPELGWMFVCCYLAK